MIRWENKNLSYTNDKLDFSYIFKNLNNLKSKFNENGAARHLIRNTSTRLFSNDLMLSCIGCTVAKIEGDLDDIIGIHTRIGTIYRPGTAIAEVWETLNEGLSRLDLTKINSTLALFIDARLAFKVYLEDKRYLRESYNIIGNWSYIAEMINLKLKDLGIDKEIPMKITDLKAGKHFFDASDYWMDWKSSNDF